MIHSRLHLLGFLPIAAAVFVSACTADPPGQPEEIGVLQVPLTSVGTDGTRFALAGTFELVGPEALSKVVNATDANFATADLVTMNPRVGTYELTLSQWRLARVLGTDAGVPDTELAPGTILLNPAKQVVQIRNGQTTSVVYRFAVPGAGMVIFARGTLDIDFTVTEGFPVGTACAEAVQCASHVCAAGVCAAPSCTDGVLNGAETTPDCGGGCACGEGGGGSGPPADGGVAPGPAMTCDTTNCAGTCLDSDGDNRLDTCLPNNLGTLGAPCGGGGLATCGLGLQCIAVNGLGTCQMVSVATCDPTTCDGTCVDIDRVSPPETCYRRGSHGMTCDGTPGSCATGLVCDGERKMCLAPIASGTCQASTCTGACVDRSGDGQVETCKAADQCLKINEFVAGPESFIEIFNRCTRDILLEGMIVYTSPSTGAILGGVLAGGGYHVYGGRTFSGRKDGGLWWDLNVDEGWLALVDPNGAVIDAVGWGNESVAVREGLPRPLLQMDSSISRIPNGQDTDVNFADFATSSRPTPGAPNVP